MFKEGGAMVNEDIRSYAKVNKVKLWQIADALNITDAHFSRKLRYEFDADEKRKIMKLIDQMKKLEPMHYCIIKNTQMYICVDRTQ